MIIHIQSPSIVKTVHSNIFKNIQANLGILMNIQSHLQARHQREDEGKLTLLFLKIERSVLILGKKSLTVLMFQLNFPFKKQKFKIFQGEIFSKCFLQSLFFLEFLRSVCQSPLVPQTLHPFALKYFWLCMYTSALFFLQNTHLKYLKVF